MNAPSPVSEGISGRQGLLLRRSAGVVSGLGFLVIILGCMNIQLGGRTVLQEDSLTLTQQGSIAASSGQEVDVFYPVPYASPPNLVLEDFTHNYTVVDQKPDRFRLRNNGPFTPTCEWTAHGVRGTLAAAGARPATTVAPTSTK